jgi:tetratricopeptide (TPR) repeat protein
LLALGGLVGCTDTTTPDVNWATSDGPVEIKDGVPAPDEAAVPAGLSRALLQSPWLNKRTVRYASLFKGSRCDVLLVPMQIEGSGFDRPSRDIMSGELARALSAGGQCVADPYLVDIALGEGLRRRAPGQVLALAQAMHAREIFLAYAGHDASGTMRVTLQRRSLGARSETTPAAVTRARSFAFSGYGDEQPSFTLFEAHLPEMLAAIGIETKPSVPRPGGSMPPALPRSFDAYLHPEPQSSAGMIADSANLMFLAMQAPSSEWQATDRLFSKAWVALDGADDSDPRVRRLRARILLHLHERPYALALIRGLTGPEADGLKAVLNGNLPQARQALALIRDPWERFFLGIETTDLELAYWRDARSVAQPVMGLVAGTPYVPFVGRRLLDRDSWSLGSTAALAATLTAQGMGPSSAVRNWTAMLPYSYGELGSIRELHALIEEQPHRWCCSSFSTSPRASDLLDLIDSRIEHTLIRQAYYYIDPQGSYQDALAMLERYDEELAGSPYAESVRATAYGYLIKSGELEHRAEWRQKQHEAAQLALLWDPSQTPDAATALWYLENSPHDPTLPYLHHLTSDYPLRSYWVATLGEPTELKRLAFSSDDPTPLLTLLSGSSGAQHAGYLGELDHRFLGAPGATERRLQELPKALNTVEHLKDELALDRDNWQIYTALGWLQLRQDQFADVERTILSYPPFTDAKPKDPVMLSNFASAWAHNLLWRGAISEATPLLQRASGYHVYSAAEGWSAGRLALLHGEYPEAARSFLEIGSQYQDLTAYRELISLLFAGGEDQAAWSLFDKITRQYQSWGLWTAAMIGHRRAGTPDDALTRWYLERLRSASNGEARDNLRGHAFLEHIVDRAWSADLPEKLQALASPGDVSVHADGKVYLTFPASGPVRVGPSEFGALRHPKLTPQTHVPDRYVMAAEALVAMQADHYDEAVAKFDAFSVYYGIEREFLLPYFAYSAAKAGDPNALRAYLEHLPGDRQGFEVSLARAVFTGLSGQSTAASALLRRAFDNWADAHGDYFPVSAYQYINVCLLLQETTGAQLCGDSPLRLAQLLRRVEPAFAFAHAAVAHLSTDSHEQTEALAAALYLDPDSHWAKQTPEALQAAARNALKARDSSLGRQHPDARWRAIEIEAGVMNEQ